MFGRTLLKRGIHTVPKLPNTEQLIKDGIPNIFSKGGLQLAWFERQKYLCEKLSMVTAGTNLESLHPFHILLQTKRKPFEINTFNIASATHNNHLFIENILPTPDIINSQLKPSRLFESKIKDSFGENISWDIIKDRMIKIAEKDVIGQGWLFLIENENKKLHILTCQNNGTPYYFPLNQSMDLNNILKNDHIDTLQQLELLMKNPKNKIRDWTLPLICISLWDHSYIHDYGVDGREKYLKNVLDNLNWSVINNRLTTF